MRLYICSFSQHEVFERGLSGRATRQAQRNLVSSKKPGFWLSAPRAARSRETRADHQNGSTKLPNPYETDVLRLAHTARTIILEIRLEQGLDRRYFRPIFFVTSGG
jgi:hypothetical protein